MTRTLDADTELVARARGILLHKKDWMCTVHMGRILGVDPSAANRAMAAVPGVEVQKGQGPTLYRLVAV